MLSHNLLIGKGLSLQGISLVWGPGTWTLTVDTEDILLLLTVWWLDQRNWGVKISQYSGTVALGSVSLDQPAQLCLGWTDPWQELMCFRHCWQGGPKGQKSPTVHLSPQGWEHRKAQSLLVQLSISGLMPKRQRELNMSLWARNRWEGTPLAGISSPCLSLILPLQAPPCNRGPVDV